MRSLVLAVLSISVLSLAAIAPAWANDSLSVSLVPDAANPASPQMGDWLRFHSVIRSTGSRPCHGVVAWISLVQVDPGKEQPMDLEDWSAHKAVTQPLLAPDQPLTVEWPVRLIQSGSYRIVISTVERETDHVMTSPFIDFHVRQKPVVESARILPVALGVPAIIAGLIGLRRLRNRRG